MIYHGLFTSKQDVIYEFGISDSQLEGFEILYAEYTAEGYEGDAFVLLRKDGKYFEINGSHCSCNGLESQWRLEPTTVRSLLARPNVVKEVKDLLKLSCLS